MYLLLADHNFINSSDLKEMMEQSPAGTDIVNCFSPDTLLKIAERVKPDIVLIDFNMAGGNLDELFKQIRKVSENAHIIALIASENYEELNKAIETGGVDDYIAKPIQKEDFMARVHIAAKRIIPKAAPAFLMEDDTVTLIIEAPEAEDSEVFKADDPVSAAVMPQTDDKPITENEFSALFEDNTYSEMPDETNDDEEVLESAFDDQGLLEPVTEEQKSDDGLAECDIFETDQHEARPGLVAEDLISDAEKPVEGENLFDDISVFDEDPVKSIEEQATSGVANASWDFFVDDLRESGGEHELAVHDVPKPKEPDFKSSDETGLFLDSTPAGEQYFEDLFDDEARAPVQKSGAAQPLTSQPQSGGFDLFDDEEPELQISHREVVKKSPFPGDSADDFLFGETDIQDVDQVPDPLKQYVVDNRESKETQKSEFSDFEDDFRFADNEDEEFTDRKKKAHDIRKKSKRGRSGNILSVIGNVFFIFLLLMMATLSFFLIQSRISGGVPQVAGYQMYIVLSGSMSPEFDTGSLAFVKETDPLAIVVGDIITFRSQSGSDTLTTHRVVEVLREDGLSFVTRGDANNVNDPNPVPAENVVGTVTGSVPYVGYLMDFVQTRTGLILLIFVPGVLIILFELGKIVKYMTEGDGTTKKKGKKKYSQTAEDFD